MPRRSAGVTARHRRHADARPTWLVLTAIGDDWHAQWELIAEAATLLD